MATPRLRVATLDVLGPATPDWRRRRALVATTLRRLDPDVVALQEVPVGTGPAAAVEDLLGPGYHARGLGRPADDGVGGVLATRWPPAARRRDRPALHAPGT